MRSQSTIPQPPLPTRPRLAQALRLTLVPALLLCLLAVRAPAQTSVQATTIPLILPTFLTYDTAGNLYFSETNNHVIRKVDPSGVITTIAGTGTQGFSGDQGLATAALLDSPTGIALDSSGNLYFADTHNHRIRRISLANSDPATHTITTIAGTGRASFSGDQGLAAAATLNLPTALAFDATGNLYFADSNNHRIRRISLSSPDPPTHLITTIAGTGAQGFSGDGALALAATIDTPTGIALDSAGNLYLADTHNHRIRRISLAQPDPSTHIINSIAGTGTPGLSGDLGPAASASLALPHGLTIDAAGNLYVADTHNHRIRRIDATTGIITTIAGNSSEAFAGDTHPATTASLDSPIAVAIAPNSGISLGDSGNQRVRRVDSAGTINTVAGLGLSTPGSLTLSAPAVIAYGTGTLTATLSATTIATGLITFFDTAATTSTLATAILSAGTATIPTTRLAAGLHHLSATYAGDPSHPSAQSPALLLTVSPAPLSAIPSSFNLLYGEPIPPLTGTVSGLLMQDFTTVAVSFTTTAPPSLAPAAIYPITTTVSGPGASNYTFSTTPASLTIAQAPTLTALNASALGSTLTLTARTASTTSGIPTGTIAILDGPTALTTILIPANGAAIAYSTTTLPLGAHTISARYSGDQNFSSSTSAPALEVIGTPADFTLTPTGQTTQKTPSGTPVSFTFAVQILGNSLSSPINLAASGLPRGFTASFNPPYIPPGGAVSAFILTIQSPAHARLLPPPATRHRPPPISLALLLLPAALLRPRRSRNFALTALTLACLTLANLALLPATGCGNRTNTAADSSASTTYNVTVNGTATSPTGTVLHHSATITLVVF